MGIVKKLDQVICRFSSGLLVSSFVVILLLSVFAIFLQRLSIDLSWVESLIKYLVLLCALFGGVLAIEKAGCAKLSFFNKAEAEKSRTPVNLTRFILFFSGVILVWMIKSGIEFTKIEMEFSRSEFLGIPSGYLVSIIPIGLSLMALRTFLLFVLSLKNRVELDSIKFPIFLIIGLLSLLVFSYSEVETSALAKEIYHNSASSLFFVISLSFFVGGLILQSKKNGRLVKIFEFNFLRLISPVFVPIIFYSFSTKIRLDQIIKALLVPGFLLFLIFLVFHKQAKEKQSIASFNKEYLPEIVLPFAICVGFIFRALTLIEAVSLITFYYFILEVLIFKSVSFTKDIPNVTLRALSLSAGILLAIFCTQSLTNHLSDENIAFKIFQMVKSLTSNKYLFLFFLNVLLVMIGYIFDVFSALILSVVLITPIAYFFGVEPLLVAVIVLTNLKIVNLYSVSQANLQKRSSFLYLSLTCSLLLITYIPTLSLFWFKY